MKSRWLRRMARMSLADILEAAAHPRAEWGKVHTPAAISPIAAVSTLFPELQPEAAESYLLEWLRDRQFFEDLNQRMVEIRKERPRWMRWADFLYVAVRILKPAVMCETGVFDGLSSSVTLRAMQINGKGTLVSIDLPAVRSISDSTSAQHHASLPPQHDPGWIVPDALRARWDLRFGDSRELLPEALKAYPEIDIFLHDSLHTPAHMYFEYTTAWPHLPSGGLLLSDDILWGDAFQKFCIEHNRPFVNIAERNHLTWLRFTEGFGAARK